MSQNTNSVAPKGFSNEELALRLRVGDKQAAESLVLQNERYITELALKHKGWCNAEDLKQEGMLALLEAAKHFDASHGTKLLTYATPAIEAAMTDCAAQFSLSLSVPTARYIQLSKVAKICGDAEDESETAILNAICTGLEVTPKVAAALLKEYRNLFCVKSLRDEENTVSYGDDPAVIYDRKMRGTLLLQLMEDVLKPRELNLVQSYLGIGQSGGERMTFQELAIRLNYNGPSGAEKAYKTALKKLKDNLPASEYAWWCAIQKVINSAIAKSDLQTVV